MNEIHMEYYVWLLRDHSVSSLSCMHTFLLSRNNQRIHTCTKHNKPSFQCCFCCCCCCCCFFVIWKLRLLLLLSLRAIHANQCVYAVLCLAFSQISLDWISLKTIASDRCETSYYSHTNQRLMQYNITTALYK